MSVNQNTEIELENAVSRSVLYLLCGLPGSGKSTLAKEMQADGKGILFNADSWVCKFYPEDSEAASRDERKQLVEDIQWEVAASLLSNGVDVILDWGVWIKSQRDHYRKLANGLGASFKIVFTNAPLEVLHQRVAERNRNLPTGTFRISPEELDEWAEIFEPPTDKEINSF